MLRGAKQRLEYCPTRSSVSNSPHQYRESRAVKFVDLANPRTSLFLFSSRGTRRTVRGGGFFSFFLAFPSFSFPFLWTSQTLSWRNVDETSFPSLLFLFFAFFSTYMGRVPTTKTQPNPDFYVLTIESYNIEKVVCNIWFLTTKY